MYNEMRAVGVFSNESNKGITLNCLLGWYQEMSTKVLEANGEWRGKMLCWNTVLNKPVNVPLILGIYNDRKFVVRRQPISAHATEFLERFLGGVKDSNGRFQNAIDMRNGLVNFNLYEWLHSQGAIEKPDLLGKFIEDVEEHEAKLIEDRKKYNHDLYRDSNDNNIVSDERFTNDLSFQEHVRLSDF
jgi:hypothetical protein